MGSSPTNAYDALMQDAVLKRRLMIDGDGNGDDRKIMNMIRCFVSFCAEDNPDKLKNLEKKLEQHASMVEHNIKKDVRLNNVSVEGTRKYAELDEQVLEEIEKTRIEIQKSKILLEQAKEHRKHLQEYSALAQIIRKQPDRKETEKKRMALEKELSELQSKKDDLDSRLDQRKKSMHVLMTAIKGISDQINEEENEAKLAEERASAAKANAATAGSVTPMETDDVPSSSEGVEQRPVGYTTPSKRAGSPDSPLEQITPDGQAAAGSRRTGVATSSLTTSPTPMDTEKSEKYDDLSESESLS